jgi:hypothetical protein
LGPYVLFTWFTRARIRYKIEFFSGTDEKSDQTSTEEIFTLDCREQYDLEVRRNLIVDCEGPVVRGKVPLESRGLALLPQHPVDFNAVQLHLVLRHEGLLQSLHGL